MIWIAIIIVAYLVGLMLALLAINTNDQVNRQVDGYSLGFVVAILVMLIYGNVHGF